MDVDRNLVDRVIHAGPASMDFQVDEGGVKFSIVWIQHFLQNATRSGDFFAPARLLYSMLVAGLFTVIVFDLAWVTRLSAQEVEAHAIDKVLNKM